MARIIPTRFDLPAYTVRVELGASEFVFSFRFNDRDASWYFDLLDTTNVPIVSGVRVVLGIPLLRLVADTRRPAGDLVAIDRSGADVEAGLADLGDRVLLIYDEVSA